MWLLFVAMTTAGAEPVQVCRPGVETHRQIVSDFYREALIDRQPTEAFARYMAPDFIEHKPDVPKGTRESAAAFLEQLIKAMPDPKWEVLRVVADGDLVALHARFTPAPGAPSYAIADFFRVKNCKIAEHWDVVAGPPEEQRNPHPRF